MNLEAAIASQNSSQQRRIERAQRSGHDRLWFPRRGGYGGPFRGEITGDTHITIHPGRIWWGNKNHEWPATEISTINLTGENYVYLDLQIDGTTGAADTGYPSLSRIGNLLSNAGSGKHNRLLGIATVASSVVTKWEQIQFGDIFIPMYLYILTSVEASRYALGYWPNVTWVDHNHVHDFSETSSSAGDPAHTHTVSGTTDPQAN